MLAQQPVVHAQRMLTSPAELARVIGDAGVEHHTVPRAHSCYARSDRLDYTRAISAHNVWEVLGASWQPCSDKEIEMIQRRGANRDAHLARLRGRRGGNIADVEVLDTAGSRQNRRTHP